jgi:hypothetical protein
MRVLVETNILLRSAQPNHPLCYQATHAVSKLLRQNDSVFFCPHYKVQGVKVYDARLVATMNVYAVESILSFNRADFERYDLVSTLHPASLLA